MADLQRVGNSFCKIAYPRKSLKIPNTFVFDRFLSSVLLPMPPECDESLNVNNNTLLPISVPTFCFLTFQTCSEYFQSLLF